MAVNESDFAAGFRKDLRSTYKGALVWANADKYSSGLPDTSLVFDKGFYALEFKFASKLPARETSKILSYEVSMSQLDHLSAVRRNGQFSCVVIGFNDVAVCMTDLKLNYTLQEVLRASRIDRVGAHWDVSTLLSKMRMMTYGQG